MIVIQCDEFEVESREWEKANDHEGVCMWLAECVTLILMFLLNAFCFWYYCDWCWCCWCWCYWCCCCFSNRVLVRVYRYFGRGAFVHNTDVYIRIENLIKIHTAYILYIPDDIFCGVHCLFSGLRVLFMMGFAVYILAVHIHTHTRCDDDV